MDNMQDLLSENALEQELKPNAPVIDPIQQDTELTEALNDAGFASIQEAYAQQGVTNLQDLYDILAHNEGEVTHEGDNPILRLLRKLGNLLGIGKKRKTYHYSSRKKLAEGVTKTNRNNTRASRTKRKAVRGSNHTTTRRRRKKKRTNSSKVPPNQTPPIPSTKPHYNIAPVPSLETAPIPSSRPNVDMKKQNIAWHDTEEDKRQKHNIGKLNHKKPTQPRFKLNGRPIRPGQSFLLKISTPVWSPEPSSKGDAIKQLQGLANFLKANPGNTVYLGGNFKGNAKRGFSNGSNPGSQLWDIAYDQSIIKAKNLGKWNIKTFGDFARKRAEQIRNILVNDLGVPSQQVAFGLGLFYTDARGAATGITVR
ncbi:hypothetical protein [uncultured Microscilla sp.]|uniref:hypothetical protein n=1 Tax=uncultured Microscilla sp. TaxID=432653 RepID=UPI0026163F68|nr:hypothetical protein [uncultured Microscilla sp.]